MVNIRIGRQQGFLGNLQLESTPEINPFVKEGHAPDVDGTSLPHDIWDGPTNIYPWPTVQGIPTVVSSSATDAVGQNGATHVLISGFDDQYKRFTEVVALNGITPVSLSNNYFRIDQFFVAGLGDATQEESNVGSLSIELNGDVIGYVMAGFGAAKMGGVFSVPANIRETYFIQYDVQAQKGTAAGVTVYFQTRVTPEDPWLTQDIVEPHNNGGIVTFKPEIPIRNIIQAGYDVRIRAVATTSNNIAVTCKTELLYFT